MTVIAIVIAENEGALDALIDGSSMEIIPGTKQQFDGLSTFATGAYDAAGSIDSGDTGWVALAREIN